MGTCKTLVWEMEHLTTSRYSVRHGTHSGAVPKWGPPAQSVNPAHGAAHGGGVVQDQHAVCPYTPLAHAPTFIQILQTPTTEPPVPLFHPARNRAPGERVSVSMPWSQFGADGGMSSITVGMHCPCGSSL
jgi:hypothetical protein